MGNLLRSLAGFLGTVVVGFLLRPADSVYFWTTEAFDTGRAGTFWAPPNLALTGVLTRAGVDPAAVRDIMVPGLALFAVLAFVAVRALTDRGGAARGGSVTALTVQLLAVSLSAPVAVTHHWAGVVIVVPLVFTLGHRVLAGTVGRSQVALLVAGLALYVVNVSPGTLTSATYQVPLNHRYLVFPRPGRGGRRARRRAAPRRRFPVARRRRRLRRRRRGRAQPWAAAPGRPRPREAVVRR